MFYPPSPISAKEIKTKAVLFRIDLIDQPLAQPCPLGRVNRALEDGKLNALPEILAGSGSTVETS